MLLDNSWDVYIVMNSGNIEYATEDEDEAYSYAEGMNTNAERRIQEEYHYENPDDIYWQAGYDDAYYHVYKVDMNELKQANEMIIGGYEITYSQVIEKLNDDIF